MKILIIGGTGTISTPITKLLSKQHDVTVLNRGNRTLNPTITQIIADINDEALVQDKLRDLSFDVVINFLIYTPEQAQRDVRLFKGKTNQYIFISTNVVLNHQDHVVIDEETSVGNDISVYGQNKAACEAIFKSQADFNLTIVRPSHTYSDDRFPVSVKGNNTWTLIDRLMQGKEIIVHDGGQSVWPITHSQDFARLFIALVGNESAYGETFHIMNPEPVTWNMIYREFAKQLDVVYKPVYITSESLSLSSVYDFKDALLGDKQYSNIFKVDKILNLNPGFEFRVDYKEGIRLFLEYMYQNPEKRIIDDAFNHWSDTMIELNQRYVKSIKDNNL